MSKPFRRALFGFNRYDVVNYIDELSRRLSKDEDEPVQKEENHPADFERENLIEKIDSLKKENADLRKDLYHLEKEADKLRFAAEAARIKLARYEK